MTVRTITLTGRPPVRIEDDNWPILASAGDRWHDGEVECQANRRWSAYLKVRQHADGRAIVYAGYDYVSNWRSERNVSVRHGALLKAGSALDSIVQAIHDVAVCMGDCGECDWGQMADDCIADLPAEQLD